MKTPFLARLIFMFLVPLAAGAQLAPTSSDSDQPIEITSDNLEVLQDQNKAIFSGNVIAKQGAITMRSAVMTVFYGQAGAGGGDIDRIESTGSVVFTTPEETAQGDTAIYYTKTDSLDLLGNVVLTREENVLKGNALNYNMATRRSVLTSGGTGRVRGLFVPKKGA